ncbi:MAG: class I SAM-dependent methyltransferase [Nitrospirales bacterium]|nr:class I SAM-dependent methyltransferase [Nitrospirales bacterium]
MGLWKEAVEASACYRMLLTDEEERYWEEHGEEYYRNRTSGPHYAEVLDLLFTAVPAGSDLLEIGPGPGVFTLPLARHCRQVTAVDPSPAVCSLLRQKAKGLENIRVMEALWQEADAEPHDTVLASGVLYVFRKLEPALEKMVKSARQKVVLVVVEDRQSLLHDLSLELGLPAPQGAGPSIEITREALREIVPSWKERAVSDSQLYRYGEVETLEALWSGQIPQIKDQRDGLKAFLHERGLLSPDGGAIVLREFQTTVIEIDTQRL